MFYLEASFDQVSKLELQVGLLNCLWVLLVPWVGFSPQKIRSMTILSIFRTKPHFLIKILVSSEKSNFKIVSEIVFTSSVSNGFTWRSTYSIACMHYAILILNVLYYSQKISSQINFGSLKKYSIIGLSNSSLDAPQAKSA